MKEVTRYKCDHCKKLAARKSTIEKHELICVCNPEGENCFTCKHMTADYEMNRGEFDHECDKLGGECKKFRALECGNYERLNPFNRAL
ncbi:hypothetical protein PALU110988_18850 [Paenibacillus lupini]|uniref:hypothetical protein n=1 Tax=Paenibacillus lupini TaxID=1450204 RepID=UPI00141EFF96|nr:hypothetical protein [Paenibacillus lupini]NIK24248.1 hypothetical protein [Paenibacillus lupini]